MAYNSLMPELKSSSSACVRGRKRSTLARFGYVIQIGLATVGAEVARQSDVFNGPCKVASIGG
jgi:hypothetical protein